MINLNIISIILIAVSLSMDAFSLALVYGTQGINNKDKMILSTIVGIYHFIMPIIGLLIGTIIMKKISFNHQIIVGIILCLIALEIIGSNIKNKEEKILLTIPGFFLFGLSVSMDSLTTGIAFPVITNNYFMASLIFALISFSATFFGLNIGNALNIKYGKVSTIIGGIILFILGITYFL